MSMFTLRSPVVLALLVLTTMTQARPSYAAPTPAGRVASMAGSAGPSQPPVAALQANGMPSSGYHTLGAIPNLSAPRPPAMTFIAGALPASVDLSQYNPPVGDQGQVGSCTAWASGYYLRGWYAKRDGYYPTGGSTGRDGFEPMYTYAQIVHGQNAGTTFPANLTIQQQQGIAPRADYPPPGDYDYTDQPTITQTADAANYRITGFTDVSNPGGTGLQNWIETAIAGGNPVGLTIPVYSEFYVSAATNYLVGTPTAAEVQAGPLGWHALFGDKYDANGLWIENSWGTGYGLNGYAELSWNFINQYAGDAVSIVPPAAALRPPWQHLASYVWSFDNSQHIDYIGPNGHVHEMIYWPSGSWHDNDLTAYLGIPAAAEGGALDGYDWPTDGSEHIDYVGVDGHVHELAYKRTTGWVHTDLTATTGAPTTVAGDALTGYVWPSDSSEHVDYVGADSHVHELVRKQGTAWFDNDLTAYAGGAPAVASGGLAGYAWATNNDEHVDYIATSGHVHELDFWAGGWHDTDLTSLTSAPFAAPTSALDGYVWPSDSSEHVNYVSPDGHVHELVYKAATGWVHDDLTAYAGAPVAALGSGLDGYVYGSASEHVDYVGSDGHIHDLAFSGRWTTTDLTAATGGGLSAVGTALDGYVWSVSASQSDQHIDYVSADGHIHELDLWPGPSGGWHNNDLTTATGALPL